MRMRLLFVIALLFTTGNVVGGERGVAAVASAHPLATAAGVEVLAAGGNAFDAAVAVSAALAVVEPYSSGLGGGGFWLLHRSRDNRDVVIDGRETAPLAAQRDMYLDEFGEVIPNSSMDGPLAAGIPGEPAALDHLAKKYGRLPLARTLAPAIRYARDGFPVSEHYRRMAEFRLKALRASPASARIFLVEGAVPPLGHLIRQPELAQTLEAMAARGAAGFYRGNVGRSLLHAVREAGGIWRQRDLENYHIVERKPLYGRYQGHELVVVPPPSSGGVALLEIFNILSALELAGSDRVTRTHLIIEVMRRVYRDRAIHLGDSDFVKVPVARLTSPDYGAGLAASIHPGRATPSAALPGPAANHPQGSDTTHLSVLDNEGNYVAATLSINYPFGSGFTAAGSGVLLNDEMDDFSIKPGVPNAYGLVGSHANAIEPRKRMLSSMSPTFVRSERGVAILGTPGGSRIITMVLLGAMEAMQGELPERWVSRPRFHHQYLPDTVSYEAGAFSPEEAQALRTLGHNLEEAPRPWGNMQAIWWDRKSGQAFAASDPRGEGAAQVVK